MLVWMKQEGRAVSLRTLRLFAAGCARNVNPPRGSSLIAQGLSVAERYADRQATARELANASLQMPKGCIQGRALWGNRELWAGVEDILWYRSSMGLMDAFLLRDLVGNPFRPWLSEPATVNELDAVPGGRIFFSRWSTANANLPWCLGVVCSERTDWRSLPVLVEALGAKGCGAEAVWSHF